MKNVLWLYFSLFVASGCMDKPSETLSHPEKENITLEVGSMLSNYFSDIRKSGLNAEFAYLDSSSSFFWVPPGYSVALSYDSVASILRKRAPEFRSIDNSFEELKIIPLSREMASYTGRLRSVMTDTAGQTRTFLLVETGVVIKRGNNWKLLNGQTSLLKE